MLEDGAAQERQAGMMFGTFPSFRCTSVRGSVGVAIVLRRRRRHWLVAHFFRIGPRTVSAHSATVAAARVIQPRPRAASVIQYQNQPVRLTSSTLMQTRPTNTSPSTTVHPS